MTVIVKCCGHSALFVVSPNSEVPAFAFVYQLFYEMWNSMESKDDCFKLSKWLSDNPWGCCSFGHIFIRFTTFTNLILSPGSFFLKMLVAANASRVGTSPAQGAMTLSGSVPLSLDAHSHTLRPAAQWSRASSIVNHCGTSCFPQTTTLTLCSVLRQLWNTDRRQFASGGKYTRIISGFLETTWPRNPGSWWVKPLWSCLQTWLEG